MGNRTYKGLVEWEDEFEGEKSLSNAGITDTRPRKLVEYLLDLVGSDVLISLEVKRVETD